MLYKIWKQNLFNDTIIFIKTVQFDNKIINRKKAE